MKILIIFIGVLFVTLTALGQDITITGKVFDAYTGTPLSEVNVKVENGAGTTTNKNGGFTITCPVSSEVVITHISYETFKFVCNEKNKEVKIGMIPAAYNLNEVSIGSSRNEENKNLTEAQSIAIITPEKMERENGISFDDIINLEPGIYATADGAPGSIGNGISGLSSNISIRGYQGYRGSSGYKIYLNGIPLTDAEGRTTKQGDVDYSIMGKTEIIKGPSSSLYGVGIGGAIKMSIVQPKELGTKIVQQLTVGSCSENTRLYRR